MSNTPPTITLQGAPSTPPTLLGREPGRIPTGGKIRPGIKVLTRQAAGSPEAKAIYDRGVAAGRSFDEIERAILKAQPELKAPLVPRNVPWFTVRAQDFPNPDIARQILDLYGEDRGEGRRLYRFPAVFPSDHWQSVMPHELAAWGANEKRYWSQYSMDGSVRQCMCHAPVPVDHTGRRAIRLFGGRKIVARAENGGLCNPEACAEYQQRQCNLSGRFLFFMPGIRSLSAFELPTNSFYAMSAAIQRFQAIGYMRGGRISGFLGREGATFFFGKTLREVPHIDETGRSVRVKQWIVELEAPVDVSALLREEEDEEARLAQASFAASVLAGEGAGERDAAAMPEPVAYPGPPTMAQIGERLKQMGIDPERFNGYADDFWGTGWKLNPHGRRRAWEEIERYRNDPEGYADKIDAACGTAA